MMAYATNRTFILKSNNWSYHKAGWEDIFLPVSETCKDDRQYYSYRDRSTWPGTNETKVIDLEYKWMEWPGSASTPMGIPRDLSERLFTLHGEPGVWWVGQFIKYLLRFEPKTRAMLDQVKESLNFQKPIVGMHVRRTDKVGTDAAFHAVDEYMIHAAEYFDKMELREKVDVRRIYLSSDDPSVLLEAKNKCERNNALYIYLVPIFYSICISGTQATSFSATRPLPTMQILQRATQTTHFAEFSSICTC